MALDAGASTLIDTVKNGARKASSAAVGAVPIGGVILNPRDPASYDGAVKHLLKLQDAASTERQSLDGQHAQLMNEAPDQAAALQDQTKRTIDFLADKAGLASTDLSTPFARLKKPRHDIAKAESLARYAKAAQNPQAALNRVADGSASREDAETVKQLYPRLWARFGAKVRAQLAEFKTPPTYAEQLRLGRVLDQPMSTFDTPDFQNLIAQSSGMNAQATQQASPAQGLGKLAKAMGNSAATSDRVLTRGEP
jgi:hypothetical protein